MSLWVRTLSACMAGALIAWAQPSGPPPGTYRVPRSVEERLSDAVSALDFEGVDIGAKINSAASSLATRYGKGKCGRILIPMPPSPLSAWTFSTPIRLDRTFGCELTGATSLLAGSANVYLIYQGTETVISARSTVGFILRNVNLQVQNPLFLGKLVDLSHADGGGAADSALGEIAGNSLAAGSGAIVGIAIDLNSSHTMKVYGNNFTGYRIAINGATNTTYANTIKIEENRFGGGPAATADILNPGESWIVESNSFEMNAANVRAIVCNMTNPQKAAGVSVIGNWIGDWTAVGISGTNIEVCGHGWNITGNFAASPSGKGTVWSEIKVADGIGGVAITGNTWVIADDASVQAIFDLGRSVSSFVAVGNKTLAAPDTYMKGTPLSGVILNDTAGTNALIVYQNGAAGASCSGVNANTVVVIGGIMTHC